MLESDCQDKIKLPQMKQKFSGADSELPRKFSVVKMAMNCFNLVASFVFDCSFCGNKKVGVTVRSFVLPW